MKKKNKIKIKFIEGIKIKRLIFKILYAIITICILYNVIYFLNTAISKKDYFSLFGITIFSMENNSMEDEIKKNELIILTEKGCNENDLKVGDIIAYEKNMELKVRKIISIRNDNGIKQYITKANNYYYPDNESILVEKIIGKINFHVSFLGNIIKILQSKITTVLIVILLIMKFIYNKSIYRIKAKRRKKKIKMN